MRRQALDEAAGAAYSLNTADTGREIGMAQRGTAASGGGASASGAGGSFGDGRTGDKAQVQVIARAAAVLRALEGRSDGLSLARIAKAAGLPRSTVQRIVAALQAEGMLIAASPDGRVRLGPALLRLAASAGTDSVGLARPVISRLSAELGETVDLAAIKGGCVVFVDQVAGQQRLRAVSSVGDSFPLHCTANGKAYLAELDRGQIVALIGRRYARRTPRTLVTLDALLADLVGARATGVAFDEEEHTPGVSAAGVLVRDLLGNPLAVSVPVPSTRFEERRGLIAAGLLETKARLEQQFGGAHASRAGTP
jgi:DNA-binding IclR family transcriptional regulator